VQAYADIGEAALGIFFKNGPSRVEHDRLSIDRSAHASEHPFLPIFSDVNATAAGAAARRAYWREVREYNAQPLIGAQCSAVIGLLRPAFSNFRVINVGTINN
jgi:hypothetical protein